MRERSEPDQTRRASSQVGPVRLKERVVAVDILRGFALFGVLAFNMAFFAGQDFTPQSWSEPLDRWIHVLIRFLVEAKFYSLFSMLFGWGMSIQMERARERGTPFVPLFLRRMIILLIIGTIHAVLIWSGDILAYYALMGFLLLLLRNRSEKALLIIIALSLLLAIVMRIPGETMDAFRRWYEGVLSILPQAQYGDDIYGIGSYGEITQERLRAFLAGKLMLLFSIGNVFAMFVLGLYIGKRRILQEVETHLALIRKTMWISLGAGLLFNGTYALILLKRIQPPPDLFELARVGTRTLGAPCLMLFYVSAIVLLLRSKRWRERLAPLRHLGRMALSNYLLQSVAATLVFYNYGLGLYGMTDPTFGLILTVLLLMAQIRLSAWWLERYQFGPAEWLWRTLTYGRRQPWRVGDRYLPRQTPTRQSKILQVLRKTNPFRRLAAAWVLILIWGGLLGAWYIRLEQASSGTQILLLGLSDSVSDVPSEPAESEQTDTITAAQPIATPIVQPVEYWPGPIAASGDLFALASTFDPQAALSQIETLTGPPYYGRQAGSPGGWQAGEYIAGQFEAYGLQPAGEDGTYFQTFPVTYISLESVPSLRIETSDGRHLGEYVAFKDFAPFVRQYSGEGQASAGVTWASSCTHDDFDQVDVVGRVVFCRQDREVDAGRNALEHGASGLLLMVDPEINPLDFGIPRKEVWVPEPLPTLWISPSVAKDLLLGSGETLDGLSIRFASLPLATRVSMQVTISEGETCPPDGCQGRNVLGVIPGRDPSLRDEVVILSGHFDHMGEAPGGTVWPGANDDASGVAVVLEIARVWQEQGYVPRRTVLFVAWDGEEQGLVGSRYYVEHPSYPLENTIAVIQLDMVGQGDSPLYLDPQGGFEDQIRAATELMGFEIGYSDAGGSDHMPFMAAGVPANALAWFYVDEQIHSYHRTIDTAAGIDPERLEAAGEIALLTTLSLVEGQQAIEDLLADREDAVGRGDLAAFLDTSAPDRAETDQHWFNDLQMLTPERFELEASDIVVSGRIARGNVRMSLELPAQGEMSPESSNEQFSVWMKVRFEHSDGRWRWVGPDLVEDNLPQTSQQSTGAPDGAHFSVAYPLGEAAAIDLASEAARQYEDLVNLLGLPGEMDGWMILYPDTNSLRADTALSLPEGQRVWVGERTIKLAISAVKSSPNLLLQAVTQLALLEFGVTQDVAPWLSRGLPWLILSEQDPIQTQSELLPSLAEGLVHDGVSSVDAEAWAAVTYLMEQIGFDGLRSFFAELGQACREGTCAGTDVDQALRSALQRDSAGFDEDWRQHWKDRLMAVERDLDMVLAERERSVHSGDKAAFLRTVAPGWAQLIAEQEHWFADLTRYPVETFALKGTPLAIEADGSLIADVTMEYDLAGLEWPDGVGPVTQTTLFIPSNGRYAWAGIPFTILQGRGVKILYLESRAELALEILEEAEGIVSSLGKALGGNRSAEDLVIKLYEDSGVMQASIALSYDPANEANAWTAIDESIKLDTSGGNSAEAYRAQLIEQIVRKLLIQSGVEQEWILTGLSVYFARRIDGGAAEQSAAQYLSQLLKKVVAGEHYDLGAIPPNQELEGDALGLAIVQSWDVVQFLARRYGRSAITELIESISDGLPLDAALQSVTGSGLAALQAAWEESFLRGHTTDRWVEVAGDFDSQRALEHVEYLAGQDLAGRPAGSPGARLAAEYIAGQFAELGLIPLGDLEVATEDQIDEGTSTGEFEMADLSPAPSRSYHQGFPLQFATLIARPQLVISSQNGGTHSVFVYREDFVLAPEALAGPAAVEAELVWVRDGQYQGMDLAGRIAVRKTGRDVESEVAEARAHGAGGLILIEESRGRPVMAQEPMPATFQSEGSIPVLVLTKDGFSRLLEASGLTVNALFRSPPALPLGIVARLEIPLSDPVEVIESNVLGLLPGSDPELSHEVIILGAHYDFVGDDPVPLGCPDESQSGGGQDLPLICQGANATRYPGTNDDASGIAVLLEIARLWNVSGYHPKRSVLFAAWGAQKPGQVGSSYYVANPAVPLAETVGLIQLDSVGGGSGFYLVAHFDWELESRFLFNLEMVEDLVDGRLSKSSKPYLSDHLPFREAGLPGLLLSWKEASLLNQPMNLEDLVDPYKLDVTGRMVTLFLMTIAE